MLTTEEYRDQQAAEMRESVLQLRVEQHARALGWLAYHTHDSRRSAAGFPDLVLVHAGQRRTLFRELKTQRGRVSTAQADWLRRLTLAGQDAAVWRPADLVSGAIVAQLQPP